MGWPGGERGDVARLRDLGGRLGRSRRFRTNGWTPEEVERSIVDEDVEWAYVFDAAGRQVLRKRGTADGVFFAADELPLLQDSLLIHNQPPQRDFPRADPRFQGGSFSERDLDLVLTYDIAEMRAFTPGWRYILVRPASGWVPDADSAVSAFREELRRVDTEDAAAIARGLLPRIQADATRVHRAMVRLARWGELDYRKEEVP